MAGVSVVQQPPKHGGEFEHLHVQKVYNEIAPCMNDIEHKAWPNVKRFLKKMPPGSLIADIGCGNGRYLNINKSTYKIGIDVCSPLIDHAKSKGHEVANADNMHIPFRDGSFDGVVSVGVIHHFCSHERRVAALRELSRILATGGKLMLYVWAYEQKRRKFESQDVLIPWHENSRYGRRLGSTSSTQSSIGGISSTGSMSEDDVADIPCDDDNIQDTPSPKQLRRQSSVSLDDITAVSELADFKPSYYSLEFDISPRHLLKSKQKEIYSCNDKKRSQSRRNPKDKLIQECRKLEASLRAMSSGSLDVVKNNLKDEKPETFIYGSDSVINHSSESFDGGVVAKNRNGSHADLTGSDSTNALNVNLDWNLGGLDYDDFEGEIMGHQVIVDSGFSEKMADDFEGGGTNIFTEGKKRNDLRAENEIDQGNISQRLQSDSVKDGLVFAKINPFLKQNSLDPYTFNNIHDISDESESIEVIYENTEEFDTPDGIFVDYKLPRKASATLEEKSFFHSVKSKLLGIFDNKKENTTKQGTSFSMKKNQSLNSISSELQRQKRPEKLNDIGRTTSKPELTSEQLHLANKLNFQVREFPLSSCPDIVQDVEDTPLGNQSGDKNSNHQSSLEKCNQSHSEGPCRQSNLKNCDNLSKGRRICENGCSYDGTKDSSQQLMGNSADSGICDVIYDGYMKLDVDKLTGESENGRTKHDEYCALKTNAYAKRDGAINQSDYIFDTNIQPKQKKCGRVLKGNLCDISSDTDNGCAIVSTCNTQIDNAHTNEPSSQYFRPNGHRGGLGIHGSQFPSQNKHRNISVKDSDELDNSTEEVVFDGGQSLSNDNGGTEKVSRRLCRYYHVFKEGELEKLISTYVSDLQIVQCFYDHANWCVIAEKM